MRHTRFSQMLSELIAERGYTRAELDQYLNGTSTAYSFVSGRRTPERREDVEQMADFLQLTAEERRQLLLYWKEAAWGDERAREQVQVLDFLRSFDVGSTLHGQPPVRVSVPPLVQQRPVRVLRGREAVRGEVLAAVLREREEERGAVDLVLPAGCFEVLGTLSTFLSDAELPVRFLTGVPVRGEVDLTRCLQEVFRFCAAVPGGRCFFSDRPLDDPAPWPLGGWEVLTSREVIRMDARTEEGIVFADAGAVQMAREELEAGLRQSHPLDFTRFSLTDGATDWRERDLYCCQFLPDILALIDPESLPQVLPRLQGEEALQKLLSWQLWMRESYEPALECRYLSLEGIGHFARTGEMSALQHPGVLSAPPAVREQVLRAFWERADFSRIRFVRPGCRMAREELCVQVSEERLRLSCVDQRTGELLSLVTREEELLRAFTDFFCELAGEYCYGPQEGREELGRLLGRLGVRGLS